MRQLFQLRNNDYNLRQFSQFYLPNVKNVFCGTESISFVSPKIWNIIPNKFKKETSLDAFKKLLQNGNLKTVHVGYVNHTYRILVLFRVFFLLCMDFVIVVYISIYIWLTQINIHYS